MSHLDPFIVYTLKLAMNHKSNKDSSHPVQQDPLQQNTLFYPSTLARILSVKPLPKNPNDQIPKLDKENLLSLLYHAGK
jgi:hypothetical protein